MRREEGREEGGTGKGFPAESMAWTAASGGDCRSEEVCADCLLWFGGVANTSACLSPLWNESSASLAPSLLSRNAFVAAPLPPFSVPPWLSRTVPLAHYPPTVEHRP